MPPSNTLVAVTLSNHHATASLCYVTTYVLFTLCHEAKDAKAFLLPIILQQEEALCTLQDAKSSLSWFSNLHIEHLTTLLQ